MGLRFGIFIVVLSAAVFIISMAPAQLVMVAATPSGVYMNGISGTLWQGSASSVIVRDEEIYFDAGRLQWRTRWSDLLGGSLCQDIQADNLLSGNQSQSIVGNLCLHWSGRVEVDNLVAQLPAQSILQQGDLRPTGNVTLNISQAVINPDRSLAALAVEGLWSEAALEVYAVDLRESVTLGSLPFQVTNNGAHTLQLTAYNLDRLEENDMCVDLSADIGLDGSLNLESRLLVNSSISHRISEWLPMLAEQTSTDEYILQWSRI